MRNDWVNLLLVDAKERTLLCGVLLSRSIKFNWLIEVDQRNSTPNEPFGPLTVGIGLGIGLVVVFRRIKAFAILPSRTSLLVC